MDIDPHHPLSAAAAVANCSNASIDTVGVFGRGTPARCLPPLAPAAQSVPPGLGVTETLPVDEAIAKMASLSLHEEGLLKLYQILLVEARTSRETFDKIVLFLTRHAGTTFLKTDKIDRLDTFCCNMADRFRVTQPEPVPVALETGTEGTDNYQRSLRNTIVVQRYSAKDQINQLLLDPLIFGNMNNIVNKHNPFGKYVPEDPLTDCELIAGRWYLDTYDDLITDPLTEILLPIEMYIDKTGKNAGITSSCSEPLLLSSPLLTREARERRANSVRRLSSCPSGA